ncbi:MAG: hypothetical protein E6G34_10195 [Actinobacteria bacterium]|nr:MAG: hypothetical protein E6G34_10195 [Actinomycetota bacterium]
MAADEEIVHTLNEAYLKLTDVRKEGGFPVEPAGAIAYPMAGIGMLCQLERSGDSAAVYETLGAIDPGALHLVAWRAILELAKTGRAPEVTCPACGSEDVDDVTSAEEFQCDDCGHKWQRPDPERGDA